MERNGLMTIRGGRALVRVAMTALVCLPGLVSIAGQAGPGPAVQTSDTVFKNVQVLKGIPVDEFMDTMGMFAASLGFDCVSCHSPNITTDRSAFAIATPQIQRARQMVVMMNTINKSFFAGQPRVSCFTCHRAQYRPEIVPSLALQYGEFIDDPSAMRIFPDDRETPDQVFDRYLQALGGNARLSALTGFVAKGTFEGFNTGATQFPIEIAASAPNRRTQVVRAPDGEATKTFDGTTAWVAEGWRPLPLMPLTGGNLEAARLEAMVSFPASLRKAFSRWQVSSTTIDDRTVRILQGTNPDQLPVNFYFEESGLLTRIVRWNRTITGTVPMQFDYSDYRDVAGVKMPFRVVLTWTDGRNIIALNEVVPNARVDAARFATPAPFKRR
jgi:hypothetical protein